MNIILLNNTIYVNNVDKTNKTFNSQRLSGLKGFLRTMRQYNAIIKNHKVLAYLPSEDLGDIQNQFKEQYVSDTFASDVFYKNFPQEVKDMSDTELYFNAFLYYLCGDMYGIGIGDVRLFNQVKKARKSLKYKKYRKIKIKELDFNTMLTMLLDMKQLSDFQLEIVEKLLNAGFIYNGDISNIKTREHKSILLKRYARNKTLSASHLTSANDVYHLFFVEEETLATNFWNRDAKKYRFKLTKPNRHTRRVVLEALDLLIQKDKVRTYSEVKRHKLVFKKIFNFVHPFDGGSKLVQELATMIYDNKNIPSDYTILESKISNRDFTLLDDFKKNPSEIYRRLNHLLSIAGSSTVEFFRDNDLYLLKEFISETIDKVPTDLLCTLYKYDIIISEIAPSISIFSTPSNTPKRFISFNGQLVLTESNPQNFIQANTWLIEMIKEELKKRFISYEALNVDDKFFDIVIPFKQKGSTQVATTVSAGSRFKIYKGEDIRFFTYWKGYIDLDLSVIMMDENFRYLDNISFSNLRTQGVTHSGDITSAPSGASEYIDVNFSRLSKKVKYMLMYVNNYSGQAFADIEECFAGMMIRPANNKGEIFDIRTVENTFKLTSPTSSSTYLLLIDVDKQTFTVIDKTIHIVDGGRAAAGHTGDVIMAEFFAKKNFFTIKDYLDIMDIPVNEEGEKWDKSIIFNNLELTQKIVKS